MKTYNIAFLGDPGVGKTSAIKALKGVWHASAPYVATMGVEVHPMSLMVKGEKVVVNLWDVSARRPGPPEGSWREKAIDATCVFFDCTHAKSFQNAVEGWVNHSRGPWCLVATKRDDPNRKPQLLEFARLRTFQTPYEITARDPAEIEEMLQTIVGALT